MANSAVGAIFGFTFWIIAARRVSSYDIGLASAMLAASSLIVTLSRLGMDAGLIRYLPGAKKGNELYFSIQVVTLVTSLVFSLIYFIGINLFSPSLSFIINSWVLPVFIIYGIITSLASIQSTGLIALREGNLNLICNIVLGLRIPAIILLTSFGIMGILSSYVIAYCVSIILGSYFLRRLGFVKYVFSFKWIKDTLNFSLGNYTADIFAIAPNTIVPIMIINTLGAVQNAYFYIAFTIATLLFMIPLSVSISLFVEGSHNVPLRESTLKSIKFSLMLLLPIVLFIFLFGGQILMIYNKEYAVQSFQILKFLALASIFQVLPCIYISIKKVTRDIRTLNALNLASSVLLICAGYVSLLKYGLIGMGYTWLGLNIAMSIAVIVLAIKWDKMIVFRASDLIAFMPGKNFISACISKMVNLISGLSSGLLSWLPF